MIPGYDFEPKDSGNYLKLKEKGDKAKIRIVSTPIHFTEDYTNEETGVTKTNDRFAWIVIDREDGAVKVFKSGVMIYKFIKDYTLSEEWGDPVRYDLNITRTEEKGKYYKVEPSPKFSDITKEEEQKIADANINLEKMFSVSDKGTSTFGQGGQVETDEDKEALDQAVDEMPI